MDLDDITQFDQQMGEAGASERHDIVMQLASEATDGMLTATLYCGACVSLDLYVPPLSSKSCGQPCKLALLNCRRKIA